MNQTNTSCICLIVWSFLLDPINCLVLNDNMWLVKWILIIQWKLKSAWIWINGTKWSAQTEAQARILPGSFSSSVPVVHIHWLKLRPGRKYISQRFLFGTRTHFFELTITRIQFLCLQNASVWLRAKEDKKFQKQGKGCRGEWVCSVLCCFFKELLSMKLAVGSSLWD